MNDFFLTSVLIYAWPVTVAASFKALRLISHLYLILTNGGTGFHMYAQEINLAVLIRMVAPMLSVFSWMILNENTSSTNYFPIPKLFFGLPWICVLFSPHCCPYQYPGWGYTLDRDHGILATTSTWNTEWCTLCLPGNLQYKAPIPPHTHTKFWKQTCK